MNVLWEQQAMQVQKRPQDGRKAPQAARIRLTFCFFLTHLLTWTLNYMLIPFQDHQSSQEDKEKHSLLQAG